MRKKIENKYRFLFTRLNAEKRTSNFYSLLHFLKWAEKEVPEFDADHVTKEMVMKYITSKVDEFRRKPLWENHQKLMQDIAVMNKVFSFNIQESETRLNEPFKLICPVCGSRAEFVSSEKVYGSDRYGMRYRCPLCGIHVGVHQGTSIPLGTLADEETKEYRKYVHHYFDEFWQAKGMTRSEGYEWLAKTMGLHKNLCHIGMFDTPTCKKALAIINEHSI